MELNLEELLDNLTNLDLEYILNHNESKISGLKKEKINRIINEYGSYNDNYNSLVNSFDYEMIDKTIKYLNLEHSKDFNCITKRKILLNYFRNISEDGLDKKLEAINNELVSIFKKESSVLSKKTRITYDTFLSLNIFKIESLLNDLKHKYKINRHLDSRFHSNSIRNSMNIFIKHNKENNGFFKNYDLPLLYYFYDLSRKNDYNRKSDIDNLTRFFLKDDIRERLSYQDIKIHKSGGTRCLSYAQGSLKKLENLLMIETTKTSLSLTLFGILVINNISYKNENNINYSQLLGAELSLSFYFENSLEIKNNINMVFDFLDDEVFASIKNYIDMYLDIFYQFSTTNMFNDNNISNKFESKIIAKLDVFQKQLKKDTNYLELSNFIVKQLKLNQLEFDSSNEEK